VFSAILVETGTKPLLFSSRLLTSNQNAIEITKKHEGKKIRHIRYRRLEQES
jgi:hypothetical protein